MEEEKKSSQFSRFKKQENEETLLPPSPEKPSGIKSAFLFAWARKKATKYIILVLVVAIAFGITFMRTRTSSKTVELGLKNIGELATQAAYFTNVQTINSSKMIGSWSVPLTSSNYVYSYDGVIKAGYDFEKIGLSVDTETKTVTVSLPPVEVLSCEVDETSLKVYTETRNIYTPLSLESISESITKLKEEATQRSIDNGLLEAARSNAETIIKLFLSGSYNTDEYKFEFIDAEAGK